MPPATPFIKFNSNASAIERLKTINAMASLSTSSSVSGRIGMIRDRVVKFNTHWQERMFGAKKDQKMIESCNLLRTTLARACYDALYEKIQVKETVVSVMKKIAEKLGVEMETNETDIRFFANQKHLLDRKIVAEVIDDVFDHIYTESASREPVDRSLYSKMKYSSYKSDTSFYTVCNEIENISGMKGTSSSVDDAGQRSSFSYDVPNVSQTGETNVDFDDSVSEVDRFLRAAENAQKTGRADDVIKLTFPGDNTTGIGGDTRYTVGTQKWQTLGSRTGYFKSENYLARTALLEAIKRKYKVKDADRLPKTVLDALNISDFCLNEKGEVTSERPLTVKRVLAIKQAISDFDKSISSKDGETGSNPEGKKINKLRDLKDSAISLREGQSVDVERLKSLKLTDDEDPHVNQLLDISRLAPDEVKGKTLLIFKSGENDFRFARGTKNSFFSLYYGDDGEGHTTGDTRFGARFTLFRELIKACGGDDESNRGFVDRAFRELKLDSYNPVYEDLPLDVAQNLIKTAFEIREKRKDKCTELNTSNEPVVSEISITQEEYYELCEKNKDFLNSHLKQVINHLTNDRDALKGTLENGEMAVGKWKSYQNRYNQLELIIKELENDVKDVKNLSAETGSKTYKNILEKLNDVYYVHSFAEGGHSENTKEEFLCWAAVGTVEGMTQGDYSYNGWMAENVYIHDVSTYIRKVVVQPRPVTFSQDTETNLTETNLTTNVHEGSPETVDESTTKAETTNGREKSPTMVNEPTTEAVSLNSQEKESSIQPKNKGFVPPENYTSPGKFAIRHPNGYSNLWKEPEDLFRRLILFVKGSSSLSRFKLWYASMDADKGVLNWIKGVFNQNNVKAYIDRFVKHLSESSASYELKKEIEDELRKEWPSFDSLATSLARLFFQNQKKNGEPISQTQVDMVKSALANALVSLANSGAGSHMNTMAIREQGGGLFKGDEWNFREGGRSYRSSILPRAEVETKMKVNSDRPRPYHLTGLSSSGLYDEEDHELMTFLRFGETVLDIEGISDNDDAVNDLFHELVEQTFLNDAKRVNEAFDGAEIDLPIVRTDLGGSELLKCNDKPFKLTFTPKDKKDSITVTINPKPEHFCIPIDSLHSGDYVLTEDEMKQTKAAWESMSARAKGYKGRDEKHVEMLVNQIDGFFRTMLNGDELSYYDNYGVEFTRLGARIGVLASLLGDVPSVNCTWGRDLTGVMDNEFKLTMLKLRADEELPDIQFSKKKKDPDVTRRTRMLYSTGNTQIAHRVTLTTDNINLNQGGKSGLETLFDPKWMPKIVEKEEEQICNDLLSDTTLSSKDKGFRVLDNDGNGHCFFYAALQQMDAEDIEKIDDINEKIGNNKIGKKIGNKKIGNINDIENDVIVLFRKALLARLINCIDYPGNYTGLHKYGDDIYVMTDKGEAALSGATFLPAMNDNDGKKFVTINKNGTGEMADLSHAAFLADMLKRPVIVISQGVGTTPTKTTFNRDLTTGNEFVNKKPVIMYFNYWYHYKNESTMQSEQSGHFRAVLEEK